MKKKTILEMSLLGPGGWLIKEAVKKSLPTPQEKAPTNVVKEEEIERISKLIEHGRNQGLSEIDIEISSGLASSFSSKAGANLNGIPTDVACDLSKNSSGKYTMTVKYLPQSTTEKFRDLKSLYDDGIITEIEFSEAKSKIINQI